MITLAVLYNLTVVVGRAVFWELDNMFPSGWMVTDIILMLLLLMMMMIMTMMMMMIMMMTMMMTIMMNFPQVLDYICDILYIVDIVVRMHEG